MIKKITKAIYDRRLFLGIIFWVSSYLSLDYLNVQRNKETYFSNPMIYSSQEELLNDLEIEKQKLGLENISVSCKDDATIKGGHCFRISPKNYVINFNPSHKTKKILKHELYHVYKWENFSLDDLLDGLLFGEYEEWRATNYSLKEN